MKTTSNGPFAFAALSAILLLAAVPACAQVTCGTTTSPTRCYTFTPRSEANPQGPSSTSAWTSAKSNSFMSVSITSTCANSPQPDTRQLTCQAASGTANLSTLPITETTTWQFTYCFTTADPPLLQLVSITIGDNVNENYFTLYPALTSSGSMCATETWTENAGGVAYVTIKSSGAGTTTALAYLTKLAN
jgi:hypothetical protein